MDSLLINKFGNVATLTLNRLEQRNAFDSNLVSAIDSALTELAEDSAIRVVKITANGKYFCAGGDLNWFKSNNTDTDVLAHMLKRLYEFPKPTVAIAQGSAFGGGLGLLACCDVVIANIEADFSLSEVKLGLVPATISPYIVQAIGLRHAKYLALTAERITATQAQAMGLVQIVVEASLLDSTAQTCIDNLLRNGPESLRITKELFRDLAPLQSDYVDKTAKILSQVRTSDEAQEGIQAFLEKRAAQW